MTLRLQVWSNRFWGNPDRVSSFLDLVETVDGGALRPEKWNDHEPVRYAYDGAREEVIAALCRSQPPGSPRVTNWGFFRRTRPKLTFDLKVWRGLRPWMNRVSMELDSKTYCESMEGAERVASIFEELVKWGTAVYGFVHPTGVPHSRWIELTPVERLEQVGWLNFFGIPYLQMFGEETIRSAPWHSIVDLPGLGLVCCAAPRLNSPEIVASAEHLLAIEAHLGKTAFAGPRFPRVRCRVPTFDLSEVMFNESTAGGARVARPRRRLK